MSNFWMVRVLKTESEPIFVFHIQVSATAAETRTVGVVVQTVTGACCWLTQPAHSHWCCWHMFV